jgi:hypothetical protein
VDIRKRNSTRSARKSELPIVPLISQRQHNFERGREQYLHHVSEGEKEMEIAVTLQTPDYSRNFGGDYTREPSRRNCESLWKKMIGKPCARKGHARFDVAGDGEVLWIIL